MRRQIRCWPPVCFGEGSGNSGKYAAAQSALVLSSRLRPDPKTATYKSRIMVTRITISVALLTLAGASAFADDRPLGEHHEWHRSHEHAWVAAPEIDPSQALSALMLLGGTVAVLRGRRNKK